MERLSEAGIRFRRQCEKGLFPGGQLVVRAEGKTVLKESVGIARGLRSDEERKEAVKHTTPFQIMSASKAIVAFAVAILEDQGMVDVGHRVSHYIPEFGKAGKQDITVLDVLTHRSGILLPKLWRSLQIIPDWERIQQVIWNSSPRFPRGTLSYHPYEFGWILGELVRRVTGCTLQRFIDDLFSGELKFLRFCVNQEEVGQVAITYWLGRKKFKIAGVDVAPGFEITNNSQITLTNPVPGASMITTASALASFYEMIANRGVLPDGKRLIRSQTIGKYIKPNVAGFDHVLLSYLVIGRGFMLGWRWPHPFGWWNTGGCVGHGGGFSTVSFGDLHTGVAIAIVTNGNKGYWDVLTRFAPLGSLIIRSFKH